MLEAGSGDPVLLVHGIGGWAENWRWVLPELAARGLRAIACDLPGFGGSSAPGPVDYFGLQNAYYARFTSALLDVLGASTAALVGHSLGGAVALVAAASEPSRITRLALAAPGGFGRGLPLLFRLAPLPGAEQVAARLPYAVYEAALRQTFHDPRRIPSELRSELRRYARPSAPEFVRVMRQVATLGGARADLIAAWTKRAPTLRMPVLVLWGANDRVLAPSGARAVRTLLSAARVEMVPDAGHLLLVEQAATVADRLVAFLVGTR
ncbi:alpha/beta fold hydrolase [soil metagenome]